MVMTEHGIYRLNKVFQDKYRYRIRKLGDMWVVSVINIVPHSKYSGVVAEYLVSSWETARDLVERIEKLWNQV